MRASPGRSPRSVPLASSRGKAAHPLSPGARSGLFCTCPHEPAFRFGAFFASGMCFGLFPNLSRTCEASPSYESSPNLHRPSEGMPPPSTHPVTGGAPGDFSRSVSLRIPAPLAGVAFSGLRLYYCLRRNPSANASKHPDTRDTPFFRPRFRRAFRRRFKVLLSIPHSDLTGWGTVHIMFLAGRAGGKVDAWDLKSQGANPCGFESRARHQEGIAGWSSQEARRAHNPKVAGSNPAPATNGGVAQLARACGSYPQCHWFNSSHRHQEFKAVHRRGEPLFSYRPRRQKRLGYLSPVAYEKQFFKEQ